jgi:hypothetical protein
MVLLMWGRMASCGGLAIRLVVVQENIVRPIANRPQVTNLPHKKIKLTRSSQQAKKRIFSGAGFSLCGACLNVECPNKRTIAGSRKKSGIRLATCG